MEVGAPLYMHDVQDIISRDDTGGRRHRSLHTRKTRKIARYCCCTNQRSSLLPWGEACSINTFTQNRKSETNHRLLETGDIGEGVPQRIRTRMRSMKPLNHTKFYLPEAQTHTLSSFPRIYLVYECCCISKCVVGEVDRAGVHDPPIARTLFSGSRKYTASRRCTHGSVVFLTRKVASKLLCPLLCISCSAF